MRFANPHLLWLLLVLPPALTAFFWWSWRQRQRLLTQFVEARLLPNLLSGLSPARRKIRLTCLVTAVGLLIVALARPQWGFTWEETKQRGLDIVVAIDTSKSMLAEDITPNRLARAKLAALDLMQQAKSDRLGLVAFAGSAFLQCPLTIDEAAFRQSVEALDVNIIPQGGTALAEAINTARAAFKEGDNYKVLVLVTDGEDNDEGALETAQNAAEDGMRIFTIGVGTAEGELLRIKDAKGRTDYIRDEQGNVVKSRVNETLLRQIAEATEGGFYLPLRGAKTIDMLYEKGLAPLPKSEQTMKLIKRYHERYHWPLGAAILLLLVEMLLPERKREMSRSRLRSFGLSRAEPPEGGTPNKAAPAVTAVFALLILPHIVLGSPSSALREYQSGKYDAALKEYQQALQRKSDDPRLHFNAGAAAYRDQKFDEAAKHFGEAISAPDLKLQEQAYYNLGNTLYRVGDSIPDQNKKMESWQSALKQYDSTLKLNPQDADAKFNREFVKMKLEELKRQQQQNQDKDQQQDQKDQQQQQQGQQNKEDQQKQDSAQQNQQQKDQEQAQQKQEQQKKEQQTKSSGDQQKGKAGDKEEDRQPAQVAAHAMTPQEAQQLLDAQKGEEQFLQFKPADRPESRERPLKDW